jgi:hypothetical protein
MQECNHLWILHHIPLSQLKLYYLALIISFIAVHAEVTEPSLPSGSVEIITSKCLRSPPWLDVTDASVTDDVYLMVFNATYGSWIYNYLCNQCLPPLMLCVRISIMPKCTTLCDKECVLFVCINLCCCPTQCHGGRRGRDCKVVGFTTTCTISAYHH